jgi:hypothetical protein
MKQLFNRPALEQHVMAALCQTIKARGGHVFVKQPGQICLGHLCMEPRICFTMPREQALRVWRTWFDLNKAGSFKWSMMGYFPTLSAEAAPTGWHESDGGYLLLGQAEGLVLPSTIRTKTIPLIGAIDLLPTWPANQTHNGEHGND